MARVLLLRPNSYADAEGWGDLVDAFTESLKDSSLDEMILLLHTAIPDSHEQQSECVRSVSYNTLEEIPQLLLSMAPHASRTSATPVHQERQHAKIADGDRDQQTQQKHVEIPQDRVGDGTEAKALTSGERYEQESNETRVDAAETTQGWVA